MPTDEDRFICALSGKIAPEAALADEVDDEDPLGEMPVGWVRLTVTRRMPNPDWERLQRARDALLAGQMSQLARATDAEKAEAEEVFRAAADAQFFAIEQATPKYLAIEQERFISDPAADAQIGAAWKTIAEGLGIDLTAAVDE